MAKHLNPLEKEFLIHQYKLNGQIKAPDFCAIHHISISAFRTWMKNYEREGLKGLTRADADVCEVFPEGMDRTEEAYRREILRLRIENERLKKNYAVKKNADGKTVYVRLRTKNSKS